MMAIKGFASMTPERRRELASLGGKAAAAGGRAHRFTPDEAREAGRKAGLKVSQDRKYMAELGRRGGTAKRDRRLNPPKENE
jgi:general stress protein YciG